MVKAMPLFQYFDYGHSAEFVQGKKGGSIHALYNCGISQRRIAVKFIANQAGSAEPPGGTNKAGSNLVAHDQDFLEQRPPEIILT